MAYPTHWRHWLALSHTLKDTTLLCLLNHFKDPDTILHTSAHDLAEKSGLLLNEVTIQPDWKCIDQEIKALVQQNIQLLVFTDTHYPQRLREISRPPPLLFVKGNPEILSHPQLAMIGSRKPSLGGIETARRLAQELGQAGLVITSGLALGIDKACHEGALMLRTPTIAVLGSGLDIIYPHAHHTLAEKIIKQQGVILSEFPLGTPPRAAHFPQRNRIISGLALGTLVIEATLRSGSLITARYALEQNREVFAVPGSIHNPLSAGCHLLLKQGAKLVENVQDILEEFSMVRAPSQEATFHTTVDNTQPIPHHLDLDDQKVLSCLTFETTTPIDSIVEHTGLSAEIVSTRLLTMELNSYIVSVPGGYLRNKKRN